MKKLNENMSSLKNQGFEGMDTQRILDRYEEVLLLRERQIKDMAIGFSGMNEKLSEVNFKFLIILVF